MNASIDQNLQDKIESGYYSKKRLRWDDWFAGFAIVVVPLSFFVVTGQSWLLPIAFFGGYLWANKAGTTDFENNFGEYYHGHD